MGKNKAGQETRKCPECDHDMHPVVKCNSFFGLMLAKVGITGAHIEGQGEGFLCPNCGNFEKKE